MIVMYENIMQTIPKNAMPIRTPRLFFVDSQPSLMHVPMSKVPEPPA